MKIVFATGNAGKLREAQEILGENFEIITPLEAGISEDIPETGNTLRSNSLQKANYIFERLGCDCFADDTGLEVDILNGAPGVHSARYAGDDKIPAENIKKLLKEMTFMEFEASSARSLGLEMTRANRKARFKTVITLILNGRKYFFEGKMEGKIAIKPKGTGGFGYDPVFIPDEIPAVDAQGEIFIDKASLRGCLTIPNTEQFTAAELTEEQKNAISHRGMALRAMAKFLNGLGTER